MGMATFFFFFGATTTFLIFLAGRRKTGQASSSSFYKMSELLTLNATTPARHDARGETRGRTSIIWQQGKFHY